MTNETPNTPLTETVNDIAYNRDLFNELIVPGEGYNERDWANHSVYDRYEMIREFEARGGFDGFEVANAICGHYLGCIEKAVASDDEGSDRYATEQFEYWQSRMELAAGMRDRIKSDMQYLHEMIDYIGRLAEWHRLDTLGLLDADMRKPISPMRGYKF
jgi:hypothetical protein